MTARGISKAAHPGFVYFACAGQFIKVGWSRDWQRRLKDLQTSSPLPVEMLHVIVGTREMEGDILCRFQELRTKGEWHRSGPELLRFIDELGPGVGL